MVRGHVSFTFMDRIREIEFNIRDRRFQSALALALTLPDICGGIAYPELVKRYRDGRVMLDRQKSPARDVGSQYIRWFDDFAAPFFRKSKEDAAPYISGERCWQLRCEYLHQNRGFVNDTDEEDVRFHLGINCGTSICQLDRADAADIRIDIEQFCRRMCRAGREYYDQMHQEKDFSLYNTPVLDFIKWTRGKERSQRPVVIVCEDETYAQGLEETLKYDVFRVVTVPAAADVRNVLKQKKPALWVITDTQMGQINQPWNDDRYTPVVLLVGNQKREITVEKDEGRMTVLSMPVSPDQLRSAVEAYLK